MSALLRLKYAARVPGLLFMGDSLTGGTGATGVPTQYPTVCANTTTRGRWFLNSGVGGDTSTQIKTRMLALNAEYLKATAVIWAGRNNYTSPATVQADIAAMIAALPHSRYVVLSIINGDYANEYVGGANYDTIIALNAALAATYGSRYIDVRTPLVAAGGPSGSSPDPTSYARDIPPVGIRLDNIHLLDAGQAIVAATVAARLASLGI